MRRVACLLALVPASLWAAGELVPDLAFRVGHAGLDPDECYRVREISFSKGEVGIYLTDGYLILGKPVNGRRVSAAFSAEVEGGDGELLLLPSMRSERLSLAKFTESPNLNEHFRTLLMVFTDDTAEELAELAAGQSARRPTAEMSLVLAQRWDEVINNIVSGFGSRMIFDLMGARPQSEGFFYGAVAGQKLGNFGVVYDPVSEEQVRVGQANHRDERLVFDVWTSFASKSFRNGQRSVAEVSTPLSDYRIEATLEQDLTLQVITRATMTVGGADLSVLRFDIAPEMEITRVLVDGNECEVWQRESLRDDLLRDRSNGVFLVVPPEAVRQGHAYEIEFHHDGKVVNDAGNGVYFVGARGTWYPWHGDHFSDYDITFRYPEGLDLVFAGELLEDRTEGDWHITRRRTEAPIRLAGFNVGDYENVRAERPGYAVEVFANRRVEEALEPPPKTMILDGSARVFSGGRRDGPQVITVRPTSRPDPTARLTPLANEVADAFAFMAEHFGPAPVRTLMVSPIPGTFGQGFSGLLYVSTTAYLDPDERPAESRDPYSEYFYSEILHAHETAHQWWGHVVASEGYRDEWLMEGLANYSALLLLEKRKGPEALQTVLDQYRRNLLSRLDGGGTIESVGPICWGRRLSSSQAPRASEAIIYEKGSWIIHMLRRRMGDQRFLSMLGELCRRYRFRSINTDQFRQLAAEFLPEGSPDPGLLNFFDQWVDGVGVPSLEFTQSVQGAPPRVRVSGSVKQSQVAGDFSVDVPIEIQMPGGESVVRWVRTGEEPIPFDFTFPQRPRRIVFNPGDSTLTVN